MAKQKNNVVTYGLSGTLICTTAKMANPMR
jgi:hypothetical protein